MGESTGAGCAHADVAITSFGYGHEPPPDAHLTIDVRCRFRDPHLNPDLRDLGATDKRVYNTVLRTPGVRGLVVAVVHAVQAFRASSVGRTVSVGCAGGRRRPVAVAICEILGRALSARGFDVAIDHRHVHLPRALRQAAAGWDMQR